MSELVERILKVFDERKLFAVQQEWGVDPDTTGTFVLSGKRCCCGLAALLIDQCCWVDGEELDHEGSVAALIGLSHAFVAGFMNGFDGHEPGMGLLEDPDYVVGYEDGKSTWNALVKRGRVWITEEQIEKEMSEPDYNDGL